MTFEKELKALKERLAEQKMELDAKDSQLQLLGKKLKNEHITDAITPESLNHSYVPRYFHYITVLTYD